MKKVIGMIGAGNMGGAIIRRINQSYKILVCEKDMARRRMLKRTSRVIFAELPMVARKADIIFLAVKPQDIDAVLNELRPFLTARQRVISIAAGITTTYIEKKLRARIRVIRTMPNLPAMIGEGMTALCAGKYAKSADLKEAEKIFNQVGATMIVKESLMDAVTAVSGSGPAYVFLVAECLQKAARSLGFTEEVAATLVNQTLTGSVHLLTKENVAAGELRARVTSKGGTTQAAMNVFFKRGIEKIFDEALNAARKRAGELSRR